MLKNKFQYIIFICMLIFTINISAKTISTNEMIYRAKYDTLFRIIKPGISNQNNYASMIRSLTDLWWLTTQKPTVIISPQRLIVDGNGRLTMDTNHTIQVIWNSPISTTNILDTSMTIKNNLDQGKEYRSDIGIGLFAGIVFTFGENADIFPIVSPVFRMNFFGPFTIDIGIGGFANRIGFIGNLSFEIDRNKYYSFGYTGSYFNNKFNSFFGTGLTFNLW